MSLLRTSATAQRSDHLVDRGWSIRAVEMPFSCADEVEVFVDLHFRVEGRRFGQVADALLDFEGLFEDVEAGHVGRAGGGREEAGEDAHGGGLPGAVRPEEAHDLPFFHFEGDVVYRDSASVSLGQTFDFDHR